MVRKKIRNLKRKVQKKRITAEEQRDLSRRVEEQKRLDAERMKEREKIARQRRISENNPDSFSERAAVIKNDASAIARDTRGLVDAKTGGGASRAGSATRKLTSSASDFFDSSENSRDPFQTSQRDSNLYDNNTARTGIDGGGVDPGDFDFGEMGDSELGEFDMNDDDDLFG